MKIKPVVLCYLPSPSWGCTQSAYLNFVSFKTHFPLLFYAADPHWSIVENCHMLKAFPDVVRETAKYPNGQPNPWGVNNLVWWTGVALAASKGYTHVIYLEVDCRIRDDGWDKVMFDEYLAAGDGKLVAGSALCYSPCNGGFRFMERWRQFILQHQNHRFPIPAYGGGGAAEKFEQVVMVNGALGVYDLAWLKSIADDFRNTVEFAKRTTAWDYYIGRELVHRFGVDAFDYVVHLDCVYSGFKDAMFTERERIKLLTDGKVVGVHQVKSNWTITKDTLSSGGVAELNRQTQEYRSPSDGSLSPEGQAVDTGSSPVTSTDYPVIKQPDVSIFIVSHAKDAEYLKYCVSSIEQYARGFREVIIMVPRHPEWPKDHVIPIPDGVEVRYYEEPPAPLGHLHHQVIKLQADKFCKGEFVLHMDSDCIFTEMTTPADFFLDGKPVMLIKSWTKIEVQNGTAMHWRKPVLEAIGFVSAYETMQRLPLVYPREIYDQTRQAIYSHTRKTWDAYILSCRSSFPYGFAEFNTLGSMAEMVMHDQFHFIDVGIGEHPHNPLTQFWSHGRIDQAQEIWHEGKKVSLVPIEEIKRRLSI